MELKNLSLFFSLFLPLSLLPFVLFSFCPSAHSLLVRGGGGSLCVSLSLGLGGCSLRVLLLRLRSFFLGGFLFLVCLLRLLVHSDHLKILAGAAVHSGLLALGAPEQVLLILCTGVALGVLPVNDVDAGLLRGIHASASVVVSAPSGSVGPSRGPPEHGRSSSSSDRTGDGAGRCVSGSAVRGGIASSVGGGRVGRGVSGPRRPATSASAASHFLSLFQDQTTKLKRIKQLELRCLL
mmetsp:Transcript_39696/g.78209  ORF Transcript_39696/g.78209 Transcript_39696/m.78209 type:complete len:237 (+) Transcript_39696:1431-2141(+)